jgi:hypothetical protein
MTGDAASAAVSTKIMLARNVSTLLTSIKNSGEDLRSSLTKRFAGRQEKKTGLHQ